MIPLKLELKNFLSYGENSEPINFKDYSLICFSGKNGNGKSALLDAITWVVWGQGRKISGTIKPDLGLLRLGQTQMMVSLEFEFSQNIYRVRREFAKTYGKPYLALDFDIFDSKEERFLSLTDKTVKLTQEKIEKLLGLDYETFVNSAFLRQGMADEFSKKSPKERKQILSNILGFSKYDELQNLASEKSRQFVDEKKITEKMQEQTLKQIELEKELLKKLEDEKNILVAIDKNSAEIQKGLIAFQKEREIVLQKKQKKTFWDQEKDTLIKKIKNKENDLLKSVFEWKQIHYKSLKVADGTNIEEQYKKSVQDEKKYLLLQQKNLTLQENILHQKELCQKELKVLKDKSDKEIYENKISLEKKGLVKKQLLENISQKDKRFKVLQEESEKRSKELLDAENKLKENKDLAETLEVNKKQFDKRRSFYHVLVQKGNWVKSQINDLEKKDKIIKDQDSPCCPLCNQVLTVKRKQFLGKQFFCESNFLKNRFLRISSLIKKLKNILLEQNELVKNLEKKNLEFQTLVSKKQELEKNILSDKKELLILKEELDKDSKDLDLVSKEIEIQRKELDQKLKLEEEIVKHPTVVALFDHLKKLEKEKLDLKYNKETHLRLHATVKELEDKLKEIDLLKKEQEEQKNRKERIKYFITEIKDLKKGIKNIDESIIKLNFDSKYEKELEKSISDLQNENLKITKEKEQILQKVGSLENEIKRIDSLKLENEKRRLRLEFLNDQIEEYKLLTQAFGKDGIQALLIEQAIPQIEEEANNILARLTDNQAQVFIESLRDLKKGGVKETLDIQISDSAGIRPYEMFSGGEAFRVDFALRIAISKLLARRAGTALQTLIIDEGFGSQDEEGLARLMDAIYSIKEDFSKIVVVSHLTSFKENFPVHFLIEKNASGSSIRIQERG